MIYFAKKHNFHPGVKDPDVVDVAIIEGVLSSWRTQKGNSRSGVWLIFEVRNADDVTDVVYFDAGFLTSDDSAILDGYLNRRISLRSNNGIPAVSVIEIADSGRTRERLLDAVAEGKVNAEDLPALLAFTNGDEHLFEAWKLFKRQMEMEGLERMKEKIEGQIAGCQKDIEKKKVELGRLKNVVVSVRGEREKMVAELHSDLLLLQGEENLHGANSYGFGRGTRNMIPVGTGYNKLVEAFNRFRTQKGVYVVCDGKLHLIHHAYLEQSGHAFLIGTSKEYLRTKPEKVKAYIDQMNEILYPEK